MVDTNYIFETERLFLERFTPAHADFIVELLNSPGFIRYIGDRGVRTREDATRFIQEGPMTAYAQYGYGFSAVGLKADGQLIGGCGLIRRAGLDHPDIGYALLPAFLGRGYAFEIAAATLDFAKTSLGLHTVLGITSPGNARSIRVLEKIGLRFEKMIRLPDIPEQVMLFGVNF